MRSSSLQSWVWQLSYAILGFAFLVSLFLGVMSWGTPEFWVCVGVAAGSIVLLGVLGWALRWRSGG